MTENIVNIVLDNNFNNINFAPENEIIEIIQNIRILCNIRVGSVVLDRNLGIDYKFLDMPINTARAIFIAEVAEKIAKYEPRAKLLSIKFIKSKNNLINNLDGILVPELKIKIL